MLEEGTRLQHLVTSVVYRVEIAPTPYDKVVNLRRESDNTLWTVPRDKLEWFRAA